MIEQVHLHNIQKHEDLTLKFSPGVNVIAGATESGKTSVFRSLLYSLLNMGNGEKLLKHGKKDCRVDIKVDGHDIVRCGGNTNSYALDGVEFRSFRNSVPDAISKVVNLGSVSIQQRRDLPYMVYYTGGENSTELSNMLDLGEIQDTLTRLNNNVKKKQNDCTYLDEKINELDTQIQGMPDVDDILKRLDELEAKKNSITTLEKKLETFSKTHYDLWQLENTIESLSKAPEALERFSQVITQVNDISALESRKKALFEELQGLERQNAVVKEYSICDNALVAFNKVLNLSKEVDTLGSKQKEYTILLNKAYATYKEVKRLKPVLEALKKIQALTGKHTKLSVLVREMSKKIEVLSMYGNLSDNVILTFSAKKLAQTEWDSIQNEICPICGHKLGGKNENSCSC